MDDNQVRALGTATWTICAALTSAGQSGLQASLDRACATRAGCSWERRAAAHADLSALNFMSRLANTDAAFRPPRQRNKFKFHHLERTVATPPHHRTPPEAC